MDLKVFNRVEKKFLINAKQKRALLKLINQNMKKDGYHKSLIYNVYFDTDNFDLIIQSIDKPFFKEKLRARSYDGFDKVFFEIKTKVFEDDLQYKIGYKRRVLITKNDYDEFVKGKADLVTLAGRDIETASDLQIAREMDYMVNYFQLKPQILVIYDRESYSGDHSLRLTFDENLRYRTQNLSFKQDKHDKFYFDDDRNIILEIKAHDAMPLWLVRALSKNQIYQQSFSKIGKIYEKIRKEKNV